MTSVVGVLLAAGAGTRMGRPKALVRDAAGRGWLESAVDVLIEGGCTRVVVVLGAGAKDAQALVPDSERVRVVVADDWAEGMSASLRRGLLEARALGAQAAIIHLVDLPDVSGQVVRRLLDASAEAGSGALARASYSGTPGHPVVVGADHLDALAGSLTGDEGARRYLREHDAVTIECGDLATGADVDSPPLTTRPDG